ncbi:hypothetical protein [Streptomyces flavidovirens]|uniref:Uncharacterized protein n=1 Tax=Streptomyces flavidovirens TaxID=67298 RepID=A0ABW6RT23_9ACTN
MHTGQFGSQQYGRGLCGALSGAPRAAAAGLCGAIRQADSAGTGGPEFPFTATGAVLRAWQGVGVVPSSGMVGSVSVDRYERIVERLREAAEKLSKSSFIIGDGALQVVPMQEHGGRSVGDDLFGVSAWLHRLSEDIDVPYNTIKEYRWVASR